MPSTLKMEKTMKKKTDSFCVFILTHGRADNVITYKSLQRAGYKGPLFFVVDNEDSQVDRYRENFGTDRVVVFDKKAMAARTDCADNFHNRRVILHARNACFDIAEQLGFEYFLELDDDYHAFDFTFNQAGEYKDQPILGQIEKCFEAVIEYLKSNNRILSLCVLQGGDLIGGKNNTFLLNGSYPFRKRKAMNSFFCKTSRRFAFQGTINEDVNTYVLQGMRGALFMTIPDFHLHQKSTQKNKGGMTETYIDGGTYVKSFYSVLFAPSCCKVTAQHEMGRLHHHIKWNNALPRILDEVHKKTA
jgi:hypothetical protein